MKKIDIERLVMRRVLVVIGEDEGESREMRRRTRKMIASENEGKQNRNCG